MKMMILNIVKVGLYWKISGRGPDAAAEDASAAGGVFLKGVDATAEPPDTHLTMDATAEIRRCPCTLVVLLLKHSNITDCYVMLV